MANSQKQNQGRLSGIFQGFRQKPAESSVEGARPQTKQKYPYQLKTPFLSPAELEFYKVLKSVVPSEAVIQAKTRLADVIKVDRTIAPYSSEASIYYNKIAKKRVDFLLCNRAILNPLVAIELYDPSHQRSDQEERDEFVNNIFEAANLPLVRIQVQETYAQEEITHLLSPFWVSSTPSHCPKCDKPLLIRTAKSGEHEGKKFFI